MPFFVRPPKGEATADVLFLAPTLSYLAYGNELGVLGGADNDWAEMFSGATVDELEARASEAVHFISRER